VEILTKNLSIQSLFLIGLSIFMVSCADHKNTRDVVARAQPESIPHKEKSVCDYNFEDGNRAPEILSPEKKVRTYFGKFFDLGLLDPIMDVSGQETVRFAQLTNVVFYKTNYFTKANCGYTASLPDAPADLLEMFESAGDKVLGMYFSKHGQRQNDEATDPKAAILVRVDSDRWTLVHEYMHHVFSKYRKQSPHMLSDQQINQTYSTNLKSYNQKAKSVDDSDEDELVKVAMSLSQVNNSFMEYLRRYALEEVTIEAYLAKKYDASEFKGVHKDQRISAAAYIVESVTNATNSKSQMNLNTLQNMTESEIKRLQNFSDSVAEEAIKQLRLDRDQIVKMKSEARVLSSNAVKYLDLHTQSNSRAGIVPGSMKMPETLRGCSHSHQFDDIYKQVQFTD
jgi:hypothetical protein